MTGIVTGFVPGTDPKLLIGDREYSPADVSEVRTVPSTTTDDTTT